MKLLRTPSTRVLLACALGAIISAAPAPCLAQPDSAPSAEQFLASAPKGTITVRAVQGSAGGTSVAGDGVEVQLYHNDRPFKVLSAVLDERGQAIIGDLPIIMGVVPVVHIKHMGVTYQEPGPLMDPANREMAVEVRVYDTTDEAPQWRVGMRHILVGPGESTVSVTEMVAVHNPADRTWLGLPADERGRRATVRLNLPSGAMKVQLQGGFHGWCCTSFGDQTLSVEMPLMPGEASFRYSYEVPLSTPQTLLSMSAPAPVDHQMIFIPDGPFTFEPAGPPAQAMPSGPERPGTLLQTSNLGPGTSAGLTLTSAAMAPVSAGRSQPGPGLVVVIVLAGLAGGGALLWLASRRRARSARA